MKMPNTVEVWRGASLLDGSPVVVLLSGLRSPSTNPQTTGMIQGYILRADIDPVAAIHSGADAGICGDCKHRGTNGFKGRACYVNVGQGPRSVWMAWDRGNVPSMYPHEVAEKLPEGFGFRMGAYGDPAAVCFTVWAPLVALQGFGTGYTHQWRDPRFQYLKGFCMASCDTEAEVAEAEALGWRVYYVVAQGSAPPRAMRRCPSDPLLPAQVPCTVCQACDGLGSKHKGHRWLYAHGIGGRNVLPMAPL